MKKTLYVFSTLVPFSAPTDVLEMINKLLLLKEHQFYFRNMYN